MRLLEVTLGLDALQGRRDMKWWYYAGASVFKEAFCAAVECEAT